MYSQVMYNTVSTVVFSIIQVKLPDNQQAAGMLLWWVQYRTERDGVVETHIEKRTRISSVPEEDIDHDKVSIATAITDPSAVQY